MDNNDLKWQQWTLIRTIYTQEFRPVNDIEKVTHTSGNDCRFQLPKIIYTLTPVDSFLAVRFTVKYRMPQCCVILIFFWVILQSVCGWVIIQNSNTIVLKLLGRMSR